jgi:hypothetical protein
MRKHSQSTTANEWRDTLAADLEPAIQQELTILADLDARYSEELFRLARSGLPEVVKEHLLQDLDQKCATARGAHLLRLADLQRKRSLDSADHYSADH